MKEVLVERLGIPADTVHVTPYVMVGDVDTRSAENVRRGTADFVFRQNLAI